MKIQILKQKGLIMKNIEIFDVTKVLDIEFFW